MPMFPLRTDKPHFDEANPLSLRRYFEDVDELCHRCSDKPTSALKIERALYYTSDPTTEDLWRAYNTPNTNWTEFKDNRVTVPWIRWGILVHTAGRVFGAGCQKEVGSEQDIAKYHREFNKIANRLVTDGQLSSSSVYFQSPERAFRQNYY